TTTVTISPLPAISAGVDETICLNDTVTLGASGGVSYTWSPTDSLSNPAISNPMAWPIDTTQYIVTGIDALGCSNSDTMNVIVLPLPVIDAGVDVWVCPGDSVQLNATGTGTFVWNPTTGLSNPNIANPMAGPADTTIYIVTLTDGSLCVNTDTITVFVNALVPSDAGPDSTICSGDTIQIGGNPSSVTGSVYSWTPTTGLDDPTIANPMAFPTITTTYYLNTTNDTCAGIDSVTITVNAPPPAGAGTDIQICIGDTAQLLGSGGTIYVWSPLDSLSDPNISNPLAWPTDTTSYILLVTDGNGCTALDTMDVIVNPLPTVSAGLDTTICFGDTIQLTATGGATYIWTPNTDISDPNVSNPFVFPSATTEYIVVVTDSNTCVNTDSVVVTISIPTPIDAGVDTAICFGETVQLNATGAITYVWTPSTDLSNPNIANPVASPTDTTQYFVIGTDGVGCTSLDSLIVTVNPLPLADAGVDTGICDGDSIQLQATGGSGYVWSPTGTLSSSVISNPIATPLVTTEYIVQVTDSNGCVANDSITVTVNALPIANAGPDLSICIGDTVGLLATGGTQYIWIPAAFLDNPAIANPNAFPDTTMEFMVQVTDANSCTSFDTLEIAVFNITVSPEDAIICLGDSVQLNVGGPNATTYVWTPAAGLSNANVASPMASPATTTTYIVIVTDINGCTDVASATVTVEIDPVPSFTTVVDAGCDGVVVEFTNTSTLSDSFLWIFGDGSTSTSVNPTHTFAYGSTFSATLVAYNLLGCSDSVSFNGSAGVFEDYFTITIPNVFTPNNDGKNDRFVVSVAGKLYECVDMKIYNRWGQLLFIASGNNLVWDGRSMTGEKVPHGSYFYTIQIKDFEYNGHVTIFE
ncbi:MAG: gliding motility-associated C-terminal domain-containing protein, partial [Flavobacteriales bacterium]|nr:gliding motility-associated C-terminal domain-containing protein [Flavobacteriales bacterium]